MAKVKNILFIMCDQLRADYLSCAGHPRLETPNIDALAARGVLFSKAYCQAPICGGSRMSFYTGRYNFTHGATWNGVPLNLGEQTMGDHLRPLGMRVALVGKTHMNADVEGMARLGVDPHEPFGVFASECGFEPYERDDGLWGNADFAPENLAYNRYLNEQGYEGKNPWHDFANSHEGPDGEILSGWHIRNNHLPARVKEEHSETAYMTNRAMEFITESGEQPWCLHLSYIKPHWPYVAPAPYHNMYGHNDMIPVNRHPKELENGHPVYKFFMSRPDSQTFARDDVRNNVIPAYMGLIKQIDDHMGRLFKFLEENDRMDDTMIVFTADHGDYLGDHYMAEKELFHEESVRIPMIVYDPDEASDATRGTVDERFMEAIDLVPTFIEAAGGEVPDHIVEGRSLKPLLNGENPDDWRNYVISESEYAARFANWEFGISPSEARGTMVRTEDWKYIHHEAFRPELFDLKNDPSELNDLGEDPDYEEIRNQMREHMFESLRKRKFRKTYDDKAMEMRARRSLNTDPNKPVSIGMW
ncbi:MAG: alkaline phosphatase family protein [Rhodospirillaceae bacterium]|jgi:arylsulfatase A-like enzyme|nr:alkaline phosphatase family protein [Rhodospirillaceae bacterium]